MQHALNGEKFKSGMRRRNSSLIADIFSMWFFSIPTAQWVNSLHNTLTEQHVSRRQHYVTKEWEQCDVTLLHSITLCRLIPHIRNYKKKKKKITAINFNFFTHLIREIFFQGQNAKCPKERSRSRKILTGKIVLVSERVTVYCGEKVWDDIADRRELWSRVCTIQLD